MYEGIEYPSSEHAYVAAKTLDPELRNQIALLESPGKAKRFGRTVKLRPLWDQIKLYEMRNILEYKFSPASKLYTKLLATAPHELIEGNTHGDKFWGQCPVGVGRNELGKMLMSIRDDITKLF